MSIKVDHYATLARLTNDQQKYFDAMKQRLRKEIYFVKTDHGDLAIVEFESAPDENTQRGLVKEFFVRSNVGAHLIDAIRNWLQGWEHAMDEAQRIIQGQGILIDLRSL